MNYNQALDKTHSLLQFGSRPGLDRMEKLLCRIGNPQKECKFIHVAGTNGKGSVCQMISSVLTAAGYKTGLFISPYISDFRERIQINAGMIPKNRFVTITEYIFPIVEEMAEKGDVITEFEFVNAVAFYYFSEENCDIVVLETGMGGLLDCTNTIPAPLCSVITPIALDHTAVLGDTLQQITYQKCGIIKEKSFTVIARQDDKSVEKQIVCDCIQKHNYYYFAGDCKLKVICSDLAGTTVKYKHKKITLPLAGLHQIDNLKTALTAIEVLTGDHFYSVTPDDIEVGISRTNHPARFELLSRYPVIILDGAHNPNGMKAFAENIDKYVNFGERTLIIGMLKDKDIEGSIGLIKGKFSNVITVAVDNPRTISSRDMADLCRGKFKNVISAGSAEDAVKKAMAIVKRDNSALAVCGSLYLAGEIRPIILGNTGLAGEE